MKNIQVFQTELPVIAVIEEKLLQEEGLMFSPLLESQSAKFGFNHLEPLVKLSNGYKINFVFSWKKLPMLAIDEEAARRVQVTLEEYDYLIGDEDAIESLTEGMVSSVLAEYCAKVLPETVHFSAYYHTKNEKFIVDAKEDFAKRAIGMVCQLLGSIETTTLHCSGISNSLTTNLLASMENEQERLNGLTFAGFNTGDLLVLTNKNKDVARFKGDYPLDNVKELLADGYEVKQINLSKDGIAFTLTEKFKIKQIKSTFDIDDHESLSDVNDFRLHHEAVELELIVAHCDTLKAFFDQGQDDEATSAPINTNQAPVTSKQKTTEDSANEFNDFLYDDVVEFVIETQRASISSIQRKFRIGYNRAAALVEQLEVNDIISEPGHNGAREVLAAA